MNKEQLNVLAHAAGNDIINLIKDKEDELIAACADIERTADEAEKKPVLAISASVKVDVEANTMVTAISFSVKHTAECSRKLDDPNQIKMELTENED